MGIFKTIKLLLGLKKSVEEIEEVYKMNTTTVTPGWKTTEFWGKVAVQLFTVYGMVSGLLPADKAALILGLMESIYGVARAIVKIKGGTLPDIPVSATSTTTVTTGAPPAPK